MQKITIGIALPGTSSAGHRHFVYHFSLSYKIDRVIHIYSGAAVAGDEEHPVSNVNGGTCHGKCAVFLGHFHGNVLISYEDRKGLVLGNGLKTCISDHFVVGLAHDSGNQKQGILKRKVFQRTICGVHEHIASSLEFGIYGIRMCMIKNGGCAADRAAAIVR